jgi:hypothetical protein
MQVSFWFQSGLPGTGSNFQTWNKIETQIFLVEVRNWDKNYYFSYEMEPKLERF